jgi:hypothetical protein
VPRPLSRRTFIVASTATAATALVLPNAVFAQEAPKDNSTPDRAWPFKPSQSMALPGGPGGRFAYFKYNSPGGWPVKFNMDPGTQDKVFLRAVGYKVYGPIPDKVYVEGKLEEDTWQGVKDLAFTSDAGDFLIQVYNYNPSPEAVMHFTLTGEHIPPQPGEAGGPNAPVVPDEGAYGYTAIPLKGVKAGSLAANPAGSFRYYKFRAGANSTIWVDMQVEPDDEAILQLAGFKLYGPTQGKEYLQSEARRGKSPNAAGELWVTENGWYVLQVYNYSPNTAINYRVSTRGPVWVD